MFELKRLQEALVVFIEVTEHLEQCKVFVLWHLDGIRFEHTELHELRLSANGFS